MILTEKTFYRTRDGSKAYVVGCAPIMLRHPYPWAGLIREDDRHWTLSTWTAEGRDSSDADSTADLVAYWDFTRHPQEVFVEGVRYRRMDA